MTREIYHEGWLVKSPPTKRIWRARWRRRWFTLKQGEIPEQFCLEYYTDRNCRKLKGVIDLDQCEQVDAGLQLKQRKQNIPKYIFAVKTPRRIYYLAVDSEQDMNDWINCICQVCNLQYSPKEQQQQQQQQSANNQQQPDNQPTENNENRQYYNVGADGAILNQPSTALMSSTSFGSNPFSTTTSSNVTESTHLLSSSTNADSTAHSSNDRLQRSTENSNSSVYQNCDVPFRGSSYTNRETIICDAKLPLGVQGAGVKETKEDYYNFSAIADEANKIPQFERSQSMRTAGEASGSGLAVSHGRTQSLVEPRMTQPGRKIPENLKLNERNFVADSEPSPALSNSSGPYIAISECISGNSLRDRDHPMTPLNSLDPKFYDNPRSRMNVGLNLTNEQPYSPKRHNGPVTQPRPTRSGRSSPTDSESVFTDDEEWNQSTVSERDVDRKPRPSDSSIENDSIVFTYAQRFSKVPDDDNENAPKVVRRRPTNISGLLLEEDNAEDQNKETNSSDTENASPAIPIGPKDVNSCVEESYDIPRSHQMPYYNLNNNKTDDNSPTMISTKDLIATSTPNLTSEQLAGATAPITAGNSQQRFATMQHKPRMNFYTNAAPTKMEGNVFRYDFDEQPDAPAVNRKLKPKIPAEEKDPKELPAKTSRPVSTISNASTIIQFDPRPPCIDRKLKPSTPFKPDTNSLRRKGIPTSLSLGQDSEFQASHQEFSTTLPRNYKNPMTTTTATTSTLSLASSNAKQIGKLEYFDLDHSNAPPICKNSNVEPPISQSLTGTATASRFQPNRHSAFGTASTSALRPLAETNVPAPASSGIVYKYVDFVKTAAFKRTREDAELNRAKNHLKD